MVLDMSRISFISLFIILNCFSGASTSGLDQQCYADGSVQNFGVLAVNMTFCGGSILDYIQTFHNKDLDGDGFLSSSEFSSACFEPFVYKLFCMADTDRKKNTKIYVNECKLFRK